ncbi:MAG TPA: GNAT family N-acetyltransferase [Ktedonobacterales bacterium]
MALRPYDDARDRAVLLAWANAPETARWLAEHDGPIGAADLAAWRGEPHATQWIFEHDGQVAGFGTIREYVDAGYVRFGRLLVNPALRRQGIGGGLARAIVARACALRPGWPVYARIAPGNDAALLLYPAAGLVPLEPLPAGFDDQYLWLTVMTDDLAEPDGRFDDE